MLLPGKPSVPFLLGNWIAGFGVFLVEGQINVATTVFQVTIIVESL